MSAPLVVRALRYGEAETPAFEEVRRALPLYAGLPPESALPGLECRLVLDGERALARASLGVAPALHGVEGESGLVGHFEAHDRESAGLLLQEACAALAARGVRRVLGPMNGSTWRRYRLALAGDATPTSEPRPFLGEPVNPPEYSGWFEAAGFEIAARYESRVDDSPHEPAPDARVLAARVAAAGIRIRTLELSRFVDELRVLHELSLVAFGDNLYYTPISWDEFRAQYEGLRELLNPELVLIAENAAGRPVAFQFAYMDPLAGAAGLAGAGGAASAAGAPRAIVKTVATLPEARGMGLAGHMLDLLRERAATLGARSMIHALMHVANFSMRMSSRHRSRVFRRYALYEWRP
jgi:GNAT superfamily N-acetyltransferase